MNNTDRLLNAVERAIKCADWEPGDAQRALQELRDTYEAIRNEVKKPGFGEVLALTKSDCPICHQPGGFHDRQHFDVPAEFFKEKDWHKKKDNDDE